MARKSNMIPTDNGGMSTEDSVASVRLGNYSNPRMDAVRGDTVPDSRSDLELSSREDVKAAWAGCKAVIKEALAMNAEE